MVGVDSAEADKVGSQGFRFCAYVGSALYEGTRHRRTTPGALFWFVDGSAVSYRRLKQLVPYRLLPEGNLLSNVCQCSASAAQARMASSAFTSFIR
jgi:hypothetical protein